MPGLASADSYSGSNLRVALMNGGLRGTRTSSPLKHVDSMDLRRDIVIPRDLSSRSRDHLAVPDEEENIAAEESLSDYCKPVELYNIIQKRLARQPLFLQRCLSYKISAAHQRSMKMTVTATGFSDSRGSAWHTMAKVSGKDHGSNDVVPGRQSYSVLVMVTSPVKDLTREGQFAYRLRKPKVLVLGPCSSADVESASQSSVTFILPETRKLLLNAKRGDVVLFIVIAQEDQKAFVYSLMKAQEGRLVEAVETSEASEVQPRNAPANCSGPITWGKVAFTSICQMWLKSTREYSRMSIEARDPRDPREHSHVTTTNVDLKPGKLQHDNSDIEPSILFTSSTKSGNDRSLVRLQIRIIGEEAGHRNLVSRSTNGTIPRSPLPYTRSKSRAGRIVFHYLYAHGTRRKTEGQSLDSTCYRVTTFKEHFDVLSQHSGRIWIFHILPDSSDRMRCCILSGTDLRFTEEFSCPFCLSRCASFKGLEFHLNATHDLFNFEYLVSGDLQIVIVSIRSDVPLGPSGVLRSLDLDGPRSKEFIYWWPRSRSRKRKNLQTVEKSGQLIQPVDLKKLSDANSVQSGENVEDPHSTDEVVSMAEDMDTSPEIMEVTGNIEQQLQVGVNLEVGDDDSLSNGSNGLISTVSNGTTDVHQRKNIGYKASFQHEARAGKLPEGDSLGHIVKQRSVPAQKRQRMKGVLGERAQGRARPNSTQGGACAAAAGAPIEDCALQPSGIVLSKATTDRPDLPKSHALLQKRQYFHSHTAQPMEAEQLFADRDSEDEVDAVIADLEDRRMLDDFVDVTGEEKEVMHLWNSFVRRNRVLADGHCPWACKEFTRENAQRFGSNPALRRCLMLFLVKLWNHHLVDGSTITSCLSIADAFDTQEHVPPRQ